MQSVAAASHAENEVKGQGHTAMKKVKIACVILHSKQAVVHLVWG